MKTGKENKLEDVSSEITLTSTVTNETGFPEENILTSNTLATWKVSQGAVELVIEWTTGFTAEIIGLFNVNLETNVTITTYSAYPATSIESKIITASELMGLEFENALFELTDTTTSIKAIKLAFTGATSTFPTHTGYIWIGDLIDFGCSEEIQAFDVSNDQVTIARANRPDVNREFLYQEYNITTPKVEDFTVTRTKTRDILDTGFATARPMIIDEPIFTSSELFLGIFDAPRFAYDLIKTDNSSTYMVQVTFGIREVA
jgi:hypothetical protein